MASWFVTAPERANSPVKSKSDVYALSSKKDKLIRNMAIRLVSRLFLIIKKFPFLEKIILKGNNIIS